MKAKYSLFESDNPGEVFDFRCFWMPPTMAEVKKWSKLWPDDRLARLIDLATFQSAARYAKENE